METNESPLSIDVIYWVTNISFWIMVITSFGLLLSNILINVGVNIDLDTAGRLLPVSVKLQETGHLNLNNKTNTLKLVTYSDHIEVLDPPQIITKKVTFVNLLLFLTVTSVFWVFRKFLKNVRKGETFSVKNIYLLKKLSYILVGLWLIQFIYSQFLIFFILGHLKFDHVQMLSGNFLYNSQIDILWDALFIWVLAHIFITGLKLKQEKDLTI